VKKNSSYCARLGTVLFYVLLSMLIGADIAIFLLTLLDKWFKGD
jgi:hypothetical protein